MPLMWDTITATVQKPSLSSLMPQNVQTKPGSMVLYSSWEDYSGQTQVRFPPGDKDAHNTIQMSTAPGTEKSLTLQSP